METIRVYGDHAYEQYRTAAITDAEIDASEASWIVANTGDQLNLYPFLVTDSENIVLSGGVIDGQVSLDTDWVHAYINSAAVFARDSEDVTFRDWTISEAWDGIRITGQDNSRFVIENVWMTNIRDDAIENDRGLSGTVKNSLFDGVFVGISLYEGDTNDQTDQTVTFDGVLMRMESFNYKGEITHQPFFKFEDGVSPSLEIHNSVLAIDRVDHRELGRLQDAWDSLTSSSNNFFLNLSDEPLPDSYPLPADGFTVLEGDEARQFWDASRDDWIAENRSEESDADNAEEDDMPSDTEAPTATVEPTEEPTTEDTSNQSTSPLPPENPEIETEDPAANEEVFPNSSLKPNDVEETDQPDPMLELVDEPSLDDGMAFNELLPIISAVRNASEKLPEVEEQVLDIF